VIAPVLHLAPLFSLRADLALARVRLADSRRPNYVLGERHHCARVASGIAAGVAAQAGLRADFPPALHGELDRLIGEARGIMDATAWTLPGRPEAPVVTLETRQARRARVRNSLRRVRQQRRPSAAANEVRA
jgi:hypothetical protein